MTEQREMDLDDPEVTESPAMTSGNPIVRPRSPLRWVSGVEMVAVVDAQGTILSMDLRPCEDSNASTSTLPDDSQASHIATRFAGPITFARLEQPADASLVLQEASDVAEADEASDASATLSGQSTPIRMEQSTTALPVLARTEPTPTVVHDSSQLLLKAWQDIHENEVLDETSFRSFMLGRGEVASEFVSLVFKMAGLRGAGTEQVDRTHALYDLEERVWQKVTWLYTCLSLEDISPVQNIFSGIESALEAYRDPNSSQEHWRDLLPSRENILALQCCCPEYEFDSDTATALATMNVQPLVKINPTALFARRDLVGCTTAAAREEAEEAEKLLKTAQRRREEAKAMLATIDDRLATQFGRSHG